MQLAAMLGVIQRHRQHMRLWVFVQAWEISACGCCVLSCFSTAPTDHLMLCRARHMFLCFPVIHPASMEAKIWTTIMK